MALAPPPATAAWEHRDARAGFEVAFLEPGADGGRRVEGATSAVEGAAAFVVRYAIALAPDGTTRSARVAGRSAAGRREVHVAADGAGGWRIDGAAAPALDGCLDVDLESSALTNAFPVRRLDLAVGEAADAPAAYVRALDLAVERLEQRYLRLDDDAQGRPRYRYRAPAFAFEAVLVYGSDGLVADYPGIARRRA